MANPLIDELQQGALIIMAPPNIVSMEQRKSAEEIYHNFQKTKKPYNLCREILENSTVDFLLFETAELLKNALIREWGELEENDIYSLRQYLLHYIMTKEIPSFVREKLLQVIAIMVKRQGCEDFGTDRNAILSEIENLISSGTLPRKIIACNLLAAIMQEYATSLKSADVGLPWEVHFRAKKCFEGTDLPRIFKFCVRALTELLSGDPPYSSEVYTLAKHILSISETVLTWGYISPLLPKRLIGMFEDMHEADQAPALRVGPLWRDIILEPDLLALFFTTYWKVRDQVAHAHHAMNCLVQFATLSGGIIETDNIKSTYVTYYIESFLKLIDSIEIQDRESLGISNIVRKLVIFFPPRILCQLSENLIQSFLEHVAKLTCRFAEGAAHEELLYADDRVYMEAFDNILEAWSTILLESQFPKELIEQISMQIFNTYLRSHLSAPDGTRGTREVDSEEIDETEETDRQKFRDQLKTIGLFGRQVPAYTVPLLSRLLESRIERLQDYLQRIHNRVLNIADSATLDSVFEDLHWLILIAGHVVCIDSDGETALIPAEIMQFCIDQSKKGKVNADITLKLLASPNQNVQDIPGADELADPLIRLIAAIFRLCEVEKSAAEARLQHSLSPEVACTVVWFLTRFSVSYLIPNEVNYYEICPLLLTAFGKDSEGALWTTNFLLAKINSNIVNFLSEITLLTDSVQLLVALVEKGGDKGCLVAKSEGLWNLVNLQSNLDPGALPQIAKRGLYRAFTLCASSLEEQQSIEFLQEIINPVTIRFKQIVSQDNFNRVYQLENIKTALIDILESLIGITQGSHVRTVKIIFNMLAPILSELAALLNVYHNYQIIVQLILEVFCESARRMLCYLSGSESRKMYEYCYTTIQAYAQCNTNRLTAEGTAEDGSFQDILLVLELLTNISTKDCIDLGDQSNHDDDNAITAADVCIYGLNFIMPLMTLELLKYPQLCTQYFRMITFICEFYPDKVCQLQSDLLQKFLGSIELGLTNFGSDVVTWSLEAIQLLATNIYKRSLQGSQMYVALMPFLKLLIDLILSHKLPNDVMTHASLSLYSLICIYPEQYNNLVQCLLESQEDPTVAERLANAFNDLMSGIKLNCERHGRMKFRDKFDKFIVNVHGFLLIK